jgi:hypothetical protein
MERGVAANLWNANQIRSQFLFRQFDAINNHPRYLALLKRIGLDDESVAALNRQL